MKCCQCNTYLQSFIIKTIVFILNNKKYCVKPFFHIANICFINILFGKRRMTRKSKFFLCDKFFAFYVLCATRKSVFMFFFYLCLLIFIFVGFPFDFFHILRMGKFKSIKPKIVKIEHSIKDTNPFHKKVSYFELYIFYLKYIFLHILRKINVYLIINIQFNFT